MAQTVKLRRSASPGTPPTTSQLALGELAINTYDGKLFLKKNVSGTESIVEIGANNLADTFQVYEYSVTSNTTVFQGSDDNSNTLSYTTGSPPRVAVYLNGLLLDWGTDFTATNGSSVTLTSAAVSGDLVQIQAYKSTVVAGSNLMFNDNIKAQFGNDGDLEIYHDASNSYIADVGTGSLNIDTNGLGMSFRHTGSNPAKNMAQMTQYGVTLNYDGTTKLTTTAGGVTVSGALTIGTNDLITEESGQLKIQSGQGVVVNIDNNDSGPDLFRVTKGSTGSNILQITTNDNSSTFSGVVSSTGFNLDDDYKAQFGTGNDLRIYHNGSTSNNNIENHTGGLYITQYVDDGDIIFRSDDGSGGVQEYFRVDGGADRTIFSRSVRHSDGVIGAFGTSEDLQIYHDATNSYIKNYTGDLYIDQNLDDKDIIFRSDDGSGGLTDYIRLDGSNTRTIMSKNVIHQDDVRAHFGSGNDLSIYHDGTSQDGFIINNTEDLIIRNDADDKDVIIQADNGSGGRIAYFRADGSTGEAKLLHYGNLKLTTQTGGVLITGELESDSLDVNGNADISGNLVLGGNLTVNGTQTVLNTATLTVEDKIITVAHGASDAASANESGINVAGASATLLYTSAQDEWNFNKNLVVGGKETSASFPLMVKSNTAHQAFSIEENSGAESWQMGVNAAGDFNFYNSGSTTPSITFEDSGQVGIGTSSPAAQLNVDSNAQNEIARFQGANAQLRIDNSTLNLLTLNSGGSGDSLALATGSTEAIRIDSSQNVGIGTTDPQDLLHLSADSPVLRLTNTSDSGKSTIEFWDNQSGTSQAGEVFFDDGGNLFGLQGNANGIVFKASNTFPGSELMRLTSAGRLGIGTDSPDTSLHIADAGDPTILLEDTSSANQMKIRYTASGVNWVSGVHGGVDKFKISKHTGFGTNDYFTIDNSGDVGIGTDSPDTKLDITAAGVNGIMMNQDTNSAATSARLMFKDSTRTNLIINVNGRLEFRTDATVNSSSGTYRVGVTPTLFDVTTPIKIEEYQIDTTETSTSATTQTVIHTMSASSFRSARFTIQVTNSTDSTYHTTEILMVHDGTTANITEFGKVFTANEEATFDADISSGNIRLLATPATTDSMEFKVVCHSITV